MARILVVDDEQNILDVVSSLLHADGHECTTIVDGEKARKLLMDGGNFDLMISDIRMSPVNGMELLKAAHDACPAMTVIMLTAYGQVETAVEALQLGAFDYIAKPFKVNTLLTTVRRALECRDFEAADKATQKPMTVKAKK